MIAVVRLPFQSKNGHVVEGSFTITPEGYDKQIEKLNTLLNTGYRVHAVIPMEDRLYKGAVLVLHKKDPDGNPS